MSEWTKMLNQISDKFWILAVLVALGILVLYQPTELIEKAFWLVLGSLMTVLKGNALTQNFLVPQEADVKAYIESVTEEDR